MNKNKTTIELTDTDLKIFQANTSGVMMHCDTRSVTSNADDDIARLLKSMIALLPVKTQDITLLIPRRAVILRHMSFPTDKPDEIEDMIGLQLINKIPYPVEDVMYRYHVLSRDSDGQTKVLVTVIHKEVSRRYSRILQMAGMPDGKLVLSSLGIVQWLTFQEKNQNRRKSVPTAIVNIDAEHCEVCFCHNKRLIFSRQLNLGRDQIVAAKAKDLLNQIMLSFETYHRQSMGPDIEKVLILSLHSEGEILKKQLEENIDLNVSVLKPIYGITCLQNIEQVVFRAQELCSLTAGLGLVLRDAHHTYNLAPVEVHAAKQMRRQKRQWVKFFSLLAVAGTLCVAGELIDIRFKKNILESLESKMTALSSQVDESEEKMRLVRYFDEQSKQQVFVPDLMDALGRLTPEEITYRSLSMDNRGHLTIEGYAPSNAKINDFQSRLIKSNRFADVDLKFATKRTIANKPVVDFKMASQLGGIDE